MIVNDIWGQIKIEEDYIGIINSKEFTDLKNKTQLGLNCNPNAVHTRYQHSLGTYFLACKLVEICKNKFNDILDITIEDEQAVKCMALVHDIGHGCFSHVSEKFLEGTHEDRTISILLDDNSEIHKVIIDSFGDNVLKKVVYLIEMKEKIKGNTILENDNNLILVVSKLLSGGIDIDRIDYIFRDSKFVTGELNDFSKILDSIDLEYIGDSLEIVFNSEAEFAIANFFNKRFELYDSLYFDNETRVLEDIFGKFLKLTNTKLSWDITEIEMNNSFRLFATSSNPIIKRYSSLLASRKLDENFIIKEINDASAYNSYKKRLLNFVPELQDYDSTIFESSSIVSVYKRENKLFINKNGLIEDISDSSRILNSELTKQKNVFAIDLKLLGICLQLDGVSKENIDKIMKKINMVTSIEIEQEKKYIFCEQNLKNPEDNFTQIAEKLKISQPKYINNIDIYYDDNNILEMHRITVRKRTNEKTTEWTVKSPLKDATSISKRIEKNFSNTHDVIEFLQSEWNLPVKDLREKVVLKTSRAKYDLEILGGLFEIVFDKTIPSLGEIEYAPSYMVECEFKKGNSCGLYFIDKEIKKFKFVKECSLSKKEIALKNIGDVTTKNSDYEKELEKFFVGNLELLERLKLLDLKKRSIIYLKEKYGDLEQPIVIGISGTPRSGKTTCIDNLFEFFRKSDLRTLYLDEPAELIYKTLKNKEEKKKLLLDRVGFVEQQFLLAKKALEESILGNDVILCDRGVIDPFIWYDMYYQLGMISTENYKSFLLRLREIKKYNNVFYALFTETEEALKRDYLSSLSIEPRTTINYSNVQRFNDSLKRMLPVIKSEIGEVELIDTTKAGKMDSSIVIADKILDQIKRIYLRR